MVELASALGQKRLKATRARMIAARSSSPYFDSASWVRCFEVGLRKAWKGLRRKQTKGLKSLPHLLVGRGGADALRPHFVALQQLASLH